MPTALPVYNQPVHETEPLIESPASRIRVLSERVIRCWRRWPRVLLTLCAFVYVFVLVIWASNNASKTIDNQQVASAYEESALPVKPFPSGEVVSRRLRCIAWRATGKCRPNGPREPQNDKSCSDIIINDVSGYCEVEDIDTGDRFRVMRKHCNSLKRNVKLRCSDALTFVNYRVEGHAAVEKALVPGFSLPHVAQSGQTSRDGIVMVVYPKVLASAYAAIRILREVLECRLPIEIWFHVDEIGDNFALLAPLQQLASFVVMSHSIRCTTRAQWDSSPRCSPSTTAISTVCCSLTRTTYPYVTRT